MRYAVAVALLAVIALVFGLYGSDSLLFLAFFGWPVAVGSLLSALTRMRLSRAMFISACVGVVPGGLLALGNLFFGHHSPSADMTNEGAFLLILIVLAVPNALAGAAGGFLGVLLRKPATVVPE